MNALEKHIRAQLDHLPWPKATQSLQIGVQIKGKTVAQLKLGKSYKYFDLASLTKIIFTTSLYMRIEDKKIRPVTAKIQKDWSEFHHKNIKIKDLLTHSAGMPAWFPFYRKLRKAKNYPEAQAILKTELLAIKPTATKKAVYSDIDFLLLRFHLEALLQVPLELMWQALAKDLKLTNIHFCKDNKPKFKRLMYAPTENCPWRKKILRGEVHDDNTWSLGGVSTHAGLFGDLESVLKYTKLLRDAVHIKKGSLLAKNKTAKKFTRRAIAESCGDWATGFMMPSKDYRSCGQYFSKQSFGHTGFTGTSIWHDPKKDLSVLILSNRVHPRRTNNRMKKLRPYIHDIIVEGLQAKGLLKA